MLPDPTGQVTLHRQLDTGLVLKRIGVPLGVLGIIFESRPDAVMQISALALKSGNGVILKGGREAIHSCTALVKAIRQGITEAGCDPNVVQLLTTREETNALLALDKYVDLIIPRGSNAFVQYVQNNTRIPVLGHADGICHLYIDEAADIEQSTRIAVDSKANYPSACNAIETLLVHQDIAEKALPAIAQALQAESVALRGDEKSQQILSNTPHLNMLNIEAATEEDWATEYSDLILAIRVVDSLAAAIDHISEYGSRHTEAIATTNPSAAETFLSQVDAANVYHNCSTRFADGFRYGFGAEVGISTQKNAPSRPCRTRRPGYLQIPAHRRWPYRQHLLRRKCQTLYSQRFALVALYPSFFIPHPSFFILFLHGYYPHQRHQSLWLPWRAQRRKYLGPVVHC